LFHPGNRAVALCCMLIAALSFPSWKGFAQPPQTTAPPTAQISSPMPEEQLSHTKIGDLYDRLLQRSETNIAAAEIAQIAKNDPAARDFMASKLPPLIVDQFPSKDDPRTGMPLLESLVWLNAVNLAGKLKVISAIPALKRGLSKPPMAGSYDDCQGAGTMTTNAKLCNDVVGRALADIGDPSVPVLTEYLQQTADPAARKRAVWILVNIDSSASQKAMEDHMFIENDSLIRGLIESAVPYGSVAGVVVDPQGNPVAGANVYEIGNRHMGLPLGGRWPPPGASAKTDERGNFVLNDVVPDNLVWILASKPSDYYADDGTPSMFLPPNPKIPQAEVKPRQTVTAVRVQLTQKVGKLHWYVRDADTKKLVHGVFSYWCREGEPKPYCGGSMSGASDAEALISPDVHISIQMEADDGLHEKWEYRNPKTGSRYFRAKSGETETLNVYLPKKPSPDKKNSQPHN
jgi:hypothetical protein